MTSLDSRKPAVEAGAPAFDLIGLGVWLPGAANVSELRANGLAALTNYDEQAPPAGKSIEPRSRRRAGRLSRALSDACMEAVQSAGLDASRVASVFGASLGEAKIMLELLDQMWRGEEMSPMGFATSVHSAAAGVVSISSGNQNFTTSISADFDTPGATLFEAYGLVATRSEPVVIVCGDDNSPAGFVPDHEGFDLLASALAVAPLDSRGDRIAQLSLPFFAQDTDAIADFLQPCELPARLSRNPQAALFDVIWHALEGRRGVVRLDRGRGSGMLVRIQ